MGMKVFVNIRESLGNPKNYSLQRMLEEETGVRITVAGLDGYEKPDAQSIRFDVLSALAMLMKKKGIKNAWQKIGGWLEDEFLGKK